MHWAARVWLCPRSVWVVWVRITGFEEAHKYGPADEQEAIATIHRSLELDGNLLDTADLCGPMKNEQPIAKAISGKCDQYILANKFGWETDDNNKVTWAINGKRTM